MTRPKKNEDPISVRHGVQVRVAPACQVPWICKVEGGVRYCREATDAVLDDFGRERKPLLGERILDHPESFHKADQVRAAVRRRLLELAPLTDFGPLLPANRLPDFRAVVEESRIEIECANRELAEMVTKRQAELDEQHAGVRLRCPRIVFGVLPGQVMADEVGSARTLVKVVLDHLLDLDRLLSTGEPGDPAGDFEAARKALKNRPGLEALVPSHEDLISSALDCARECANAWAKRSRGTKPSEAPIDKTALGAAILQLSTCEATFAPAGDEEQVERALGRAGR